MIISQSQDDTTVEVLADWLQLARSENIGPLTFHQLLKKYGTPREALMDLPRLAALGGLKRSLKLAARSAIEREVDEVTQFDAQFLTFESPLYPPLLKYVESAPPLLTVKGRLELLQKPTFAIVGARNASSMGKKLAHKFAQGLGLEGWVIASGLARGIDTSAHHGSVATGTIAVLAGGIDHIYPQENEGLHLQIAERGVLVAESPFGTQPQATLFPRRNRIISGVSRGILIVEAALKSGSLLTANHALEQGREVLAVPGHPLDPRANGCNKLIKNGAVLIETLEDILSALYPHKVFTPPQEDTDLQESSPPLALEKIRHMIYETLSFVPITIDEVIRDCHLQTSDVGSVLLEMEIAGRLERHPGGKVSLKEDWKSE